MTRKRKSIGVWAYLEQCGVLEHGTAEDIAAARKQYMAEYKRNWRKGKRAKEQEFTIAYTTTELAAITKEAKRRTLSVTKYLKMAAFAYTQKVYLIDHNSVGAIKELLSLNYTALENVCEEHQIQEAELLKKLEQLDDGVMQYLCAPKSLEVLITEAIHDNPCHKQAILSLLQTLAP